MELGKNKAVSNRNESPVNGGGCLRIVKTISWNIATNPIFFMTALGLIGNFIFKGSVPPVLSTLLNVSILFHFPVSNLHD